MPTWKVSLTFEDSFVVADSAMDALAAFKEQLGVVPEEERSGRVVTCIVTPVGIEVHHTRDELP